MSPEMSGLRSRIVWLNVTLPGQGSGESDLGLKKYPTLEEIAAELSIVIDHFRIPQVVVVGDGAGANVAGSNISFSFSLSIYLIHLFLCLYIYS